MRICLATQNAGKLTEFRRLLADVPGVEIVSLGELGVKSQADETGDTFGENALIKARAAAEIAGLPALADDSGLEVDALGGAPGVYSARYAGPDAEAADNNKKLLQELAALRAEPRTARFRCALALVRADGSIWHTVDGACEGRIAQAPSGEGGFGYDPLFVPEGAQRTFAEHAPDEKNAISHRAVATAKLAAFLRLGS